jgi:hypothetical protein
MLSMTGMSKPTPTKKLLLTKVTIRELDADSLAEVAGGGVSAVVTNLMSNQTSGDTNGPTLAATWYLQKRTLKC